MSDAIFYIHTTTTIVDYVTALSRRYIPDVRIVHMVDESVLSDIRQGKMHEARNKLQNLVAGPVHVGARRFMVTCTSTGRLVDSLAPGLSDKIIRIEAPAVAEIGRRQGKTGIVYTNPTVWPEIQTILKHAGFGADDVEACYIPDAFENMLSGNVVAHDKLVDDYIKLHTDNFDTFMLAQVSICSAKERLGRLGDSSKVISMAELGIQSLKDLEGLKEKTDA